MSSETPLSYETIKKMADFLLGKTTVRPKIGIICGTGLGSLVENISNSQIFNYEEIQNFPVSTVFGHPGKLVFGSLNGTEIISMQGRFHYFEGYPLWKCAMPVRLMKLIGVTHLIVTNAAGSINPDFKIGDIMIMKDHLNLMGFGGNNPLIGFNDERFGPRFPSLNNAYDIELQNKVKTIAKELNIEDILQEGVYAYLGGPCFETVAECRMLQRNGADAVGMSTVPEVITAVHCGLKVFGISLITNKCIMEYNTHDKIEHEEVVNVANSRGPVLKTLISKLINSI